MNEDDMKKPLTSEQLDRLAKLAAMPDEDIDFSDIPPLTEEQLSEFRRVDEERPASVATSLDLNVVRWFASHANDGPYEAEINRVLREHIARAARKRA